MRVFVFLPLFLIAACGTSRRFEFEDSGTEPEDTGPIEPTGPDGDSNDDGLPDEYQSIGVGYEGNEPYVVFFTGPHLPPFTADLRWIGLGCSMYDGGLDDDWEVPCAPLVPYKVNGVTVGYAFRNIREGIHEGNIVDADSFSINGGGWAFPGDGQTEFDDPDFFVRHVDGPNCPVDQQRTVIHYGFTRVGLAIIGLGESVAPPDPACY